MTNPSVALIWLRRVVYGIAVPLIVVIVALAALDPQLGWVIVPALVGGAVIAAALFAMHARRRAVPTPDIPRSGELAGMMNISHVRVAGFGGLALVVTSWLVALQYELLTAALVAGAVGGTVGAVVAIVYRRRHPATGRLPDDLHVRI